MVGGIVGGKVKASTKSWSVQQGGNNNFFFAVRGRGVLGCFADNENSVGQRTDLVRVQGKASEHTVTQ